MDEFSFKEMRRRGLSKITSYCICIWSETGEIGGKRSSRFPCVTPWAEIFSLDRVELRILLNINNRVPLRKQPTALICWLFHKKAPPKTSDWTASADLIGGAVSVGCGWTATHGIHHCRQVHKAVVEFESNYKKSYNWWTGNRTCGDLTGSNQIGKGQGHVSAGLVWGKGREGAVWLSASKVPSDHWVNSDYVDVLLMHGKSGLGFLGSWSYSKEWVWNLGTKSVLKWNVSRMTFQEFNIMYTLTTYLWSGG